MGGCMDGGLGVWVGACIDRGVCGCMDGRMKHWVPAWVHGWRYGYVGGCLDGGVGVWVGAWIENWGVWVHGWKAGWVGGCMDGGMGAWLGAWMRDGSMHGCVNGRVCMGYAFCECMDGFIDGQVDTSTGENGMM